MSVTTSLLALDAVEEGTIAVRKTSSLLFVTVDEACWLELYSSAAARTADAARALGTHAPSGQGVLGEFSFAGPGTIDAAPVPTLKNADAVRTDVVYYRVTNRSAGTAAITITLLTVPLEA